jgi:hypothetical protein
VKTLLKFLIALIAALFTSNLLGGMLLSIAVGTATVIFFSVGAGLIVTTCVFIISLRFGERKTPTGSLQLFTGIYTEVWLKELVIPFRQFRPWLGEIPDVESSAIVKDESGTILNLLKIGADPLVYINNTTYPIPSVQRVDANQAIVMDKFDTQNTTITDDELRGLNYDKIKSVTTQHSEALLEKMGDKAIHALAPASDATATPVVSTTGAARSDDATRKRMKSSDLLLLARRMDIQKIPAVGRVLVLSPYHKSDLAEESAALFNQFANLKSGEVTELHGFKIYVDAATPTFNGSGSKKAFGAVAAPSTDRISSVAYYNPRMFKAMGFEKMYASLSKDDPDNRQTKVGFRRDFICLPKHNEAIGAIIDTII